MGINPPLGSGTGGPCRTSQVMSPLAESPSVVKASNDENAPMGPTRLSKLNPPIDVPAAKKSVNSMKSTNPKPLS